MANKVYENFFLSNEVEDQFNSHLNLQQFCTIDDSLVGTAGMKRMVNVYSATNGTEELAMGAGNTKSIEVTHATKEYEILLAQNRFQYYDEEAMRDPMIVPVGMKHAGTDMFNTVNADIFAEYKKATLTVEAATPGFDAFVDAQALLNAEETLATFAFISNADLAKLRKALKEDLKYVETFAKTGYVGTVAGTNIYTKKDATPGEIILATKQAVTLFIKKGTEVEQITAGKRSEEGANTRQNTIFTRKYYLPALTDATKAVKITIGA
jgi:hypothetical protein